MKRIKQVSGLLLLIANLNNVLAGTNEVQTTDVAFTAACDDTEQRYVLMLPADFQPGQPRDLLIALHGHGSDRWQFAKDPRDECRAARDAAAAHGMIHVSPDYRATTSWMGPKAEADLVQIISDLKTKYKINRVFVVGGSMGGTSAATFAALHPELVAGATSMNGHANHLEYTNFQEAIAASFGGAKATIPLEYKKRSAEYWPEVLTMPIAFTTGGQDTLVPPGSTIRLAGILKQSNRQVLLIHRPNGGHSTDYADAMAALEFMCDPLKPVMVAENPIPPAAPTVANATDQTNWYDCATLVADGKITLEGKGWTNGESCYDRLPAKASGLVTPAVWNLSHNSAGLCFRFETDATLLQVRWKLTSATLAMPHMPATGVSGVDLYVKAADDRWLFQPRQAGDDTSSTFPLGGRRKACLLYLPLYNGVKSIECGVAEGQTFSRIQEPRPKPIVVYGTSIAQGGCASRPGMAWTSIVGRRLDVPVINLGFSGSGKMEMPMADLLAELDPSVYVLDCLPNMSPGMVAERMEAFVRKLRSVRPQTPIVLVEAAQFQMGLRPIYEKMKRDGDRNLYFASGIDARGDDGEGTVDGLHPTDLGMMRQAMAMEKALRPILTTNPLKSKTADRR